MIRALAVLCMILAAIAGPAAAQSISIYNDVSTKQPNPHSNSAAGASSGVSSDEDFAAESELLVAANRSRSLAGAPPLRMDESLHQAALAHARLMLPGQQLSHQLSGEDSLLVRIAQVSPLKMDRVGENLAYANCASDANDVLMRSAPHRENLLDRGFNVAGIAAVWSKGKLYVVQDFGHELPSYSSQQSAKLVSDAIDQMRQQAGLPQLAQLMPPNLDQAACSLAREDRPNAHLLATAYGERNYNRNDNRKIITYTQGRPEVLPQGALRMLGDPNVRQFAVGSCYARNAAYPTGTYWVAILLY
jgi:uncharacterized protein YkwD